MQLSLPEKGLSQYLIKVHGMKFKIDENLPVEVAELFRQAGYNAMTVLEENLSGAADAILAGICQKELRVLITLDTDFADIRTYPPKEFSGLIVLRLKHQDKNSILEIINRLIRILPIEPIKSQMWIVEEDRIRIRT